jgi:hypothetical protein
VSEPSLSRDLRVSLATCYANKRTIYASLEVLRRNIIRCRARWPAPGTHAELVRLGEQERGLNADLDRVDVDIASYRARIRDQP